ncbi:MAG: Gfo/Idh/MocA family oxidoreductase [Caldilineaceae bacterium]|nr:Gfo/Idh/MocA family oxidoreductase [Caldilineaceae bacterium]
MTDLRIGVIGAGGRGGLAAYAHQPEAGARIVACCDMDDAVLARCRERYGNDILTTHEYRTLLEQDLDAVFVATPDFWHEEHGIAALEAGKAVYLEKPLAITIPGCDRILATAVRTQGTLYVGHNMRHMAFVLKMKELIDSGAIGEVKTAWCRHFVGHGGDFYYKDWHADRRYSTGLLLQKTTHDLDVLHWLCGGYSTLVNALGGLTLFGQITDRIGPAEKGRNPGARLEHWPPLTHKNLFHTVDVEDISMMNMLLDNGVYVAYQQCHYTPDYWRNYTFIGTEGRLENVGNGEEGTVIKVWNKRHKGYAEADEIVPIVQETGSHGGADPKIVNEFLDVVRGKAKPSTSPVAARYSVAAGCAATESLRNGGQPITIERLPAATTAYFA